MSIFVAKVISTCLDSSDPGPTSTTSAGASGSVLMVASRPSRTGDGTVVIGQVDQHHVPGLTFHQGGDGRMRQFRPDD